MSLFSALNSATASLRTVQSQVKVVSDNVARSDDPSRTRHTLEQKVDRSGQVLTAEYRREVDAALRSQVQDLTARTATYDTQNTYMQKLGDLMRTTNGSPLLNKYASAFDTAMKTLATSPEDETAQQEFLRAADTLSREVKRVSQGVEDLNREMQKDTTDSVTQLNDLLKQVDRINKDMVSLQGYGDSANVVADKRDALVKQISELVSVRTVERQDGRLAIFTSSGLSLLDAEPANLTYDGNNLVVTNEGQSMTVNDHFTDGKLSALQNMRYDGSAKEPPSLASSDPTKEVIRKLRSQLDTYAQAFTGATKEGEATSFADAYNNASPVKDGEQNFYFFTGTDRFSIAVNPKLMNGEMKIKESAIPDMAKAMNATGRSMTSDGLKLSNTSYSGMASSLTGVWMSTAGTVSTNLAASKESRDLLEERYVNNTGVNIDEEIANLQQLQTSYAASARVMQVANSMFDALERIVG